MKRILLISAGSLLGLCVICLALGYFVGIPKLQQGMEDQVQEAISTYVAPQIAGIGVTPSAGTHTLTEEEVNSEIQAGNPDLKDFRFEITPDQIELRFGQQGQDVSYTAEVSAIDGRIKVSNEQVDGLPGWILPKDSISDGVEKGINAYLDENNLSVSSVTLGEDEMTIVLENSR